MISYSNIPDIKYAIIYEKYMLKMDDTDKDIDNIYTN